MTNKLQFLFVRSYAKHYYLKRRKKINFTTEIMLTKIVSMGL